MRRALSICLVFVLAVFAGCSSTETKNDYVDTVNEIQGDVNTALTDATSGLGSSNSAVLGALEESESALTDAVDRLNEVDVPDEAAGSHPDLVAAIDELRELVAGTAKAVEKGRGTEAIRSLTELATEATAIDKKITAATTQINEDLGAE